MEIEIKWKSKPKDLKFAEALEATPYFPNEMQDEAENQ